MVKTPWILSTKFEKLILNPIFVPKQELGNEDKKLSHNLRFQARTPCGS
jgi:hypothetical protein